MAERHQELIDSLSSRGWLATIGRYAFFFVVLVLLAIYIGILLFGTNSVEVLYKLNVQEKTLQRKIKFLKNENARLQKRYFELKELEPDQ